MAISVVRKSKNINWFAIAIGSFVLLFVGGVVYFLFISTPPGIDKIIPPPPEEEIVKGVNEIISGIDIQSVITKIRSLEDPIAPITIGDPGEFGRNNPFLPI